MNGPRRAQGQGHADGTLVELDVGAVTHAGSCVARLDGRVVFVRHTLPGERVVARVTDSSHERYWRADAVEVLRASPDRVSPPCPHAGPGGCGGCDWQHASLATQRRLAGTVVAEALRRLAGIDVDVQVEEAGEGGDAGGSAAGLGWRTRVRFALAPDGEVGLREHRSHRVVPTPDCPVAHPMVTAAVAGRRFEGAAAVEVAVSPATGSVSVSPIPGKGGVQDGHAGAEFVEMVGRREFRLDPGSFWQVHVAAAETLVGAVLAGLEPRPGETALDLYAGAGLFAAFLAEAVGPAGHVVAMEADPPAVASAARSLVDLPQVSLRPVRVTPGAMRGLGGRWRHPVDVVVLDPPRAGAGPEVVAAVLGYQPRAVAYVACDPAALGRDLAAAHDAGYRLASIRAFALFPMTSHVECVAILVPR